jgi:hypothetical protein
MTLRIGPNGERWVYAIGPDISPVGAAPLMKMLAPALSLLTQDPSSAPFATHPDTGEPVIKDLGTSWFLRPDWPVGDLRINPQENHIITYGVHWDSATQRMHFLSDLFYQVTGTPHHTYTYADSIDSRDNAVAHGPWLSLSCGDALVRGQMVELPLYLQGFGSRIAFGSGGLASGAAACSYGPSLWIPRPLPSGDPGPGVIGTYQAVPLLHFYRPDQTRFCPRDTNYFVISGGSDPDLGFYRNPDAGGGYWSPMDLSMSATWIETPTLRGVLFGCTMAQGTVRYDPTIPGTTCTDGFRYYFYVFDPSDLADVANRLKQPWEPTPRYWPIDEMVPRPPNDGLGRLHGMFTEVAPDGNTYLHVLDSGAVVDGASPPYPAVAVYRIVENG